MLCRLGLSESHEVERAKFLAKRRKMGLVQ